MTVWFCLFSFHSLSYYPRRGGYMYFQSGFIVCFSAEWRKKKASGLFFSWNWWEVVWTQTTGRPSETIWNPAVTELFPFIATNSGFLWQFHEATFILEMPAPFIYWFLLPGCFFRSVVAVIRTCSDVYIHVLLLTVMLLWSTLWFYICERCFKTKTLLA